MKFIFLVRIKPDAAMRAVLEEYFEIVDFIPVGEFEEPEWVVSPP